MKQPVVAVGSDLSFSSPRSGSGWPCQRTLTLACGHEIRVTTGRSEGYYRPPTSETIPSVVTCRHCARAGRVSDAAAPTHTELCGLAGVWLRSRCSVVLVEPHTYGPEKPDVIGWSGDSVVLECKASRADFRADAKKPHRSSTMAMGNERWFFAPSGVVPAVDLPDGWGLLEWDGRVVHTVRATVRRPTLPPEAMMAEREILLNALRKAQGTDATPPHPGA